VLGYPTNFPPSNTYSDLQGTNLLEINLWCR